MSDFNWETDDEQWDEADSIPSHDTARVRRFPRWLLPLLLLALICVAVGVYLWLNSTVDTVEQDTIVQVANSYANLYETANRGDAELFDTMLSGRDEEWTRSYQELFAVRGLLDRSPLGLELRVPVPLIREPIDLSPDMSAAIVTTTLEYSFDVGNGITETADLIHTNTFRKGIDGWLYSPPDETYWGVDISIEGPRYRMIAPARDEALLRRLYRDLDFLTVELCQAGYDCSESKIPQLLIHFQKEPAILNRWQAFSLLDRGGSALVELPTPSLIGTPANRAAYQAMLAGYSHHILPQIMMLGSDYECCNRETWFWAIARYQLGRQGLLPNRLPPASYEALAGVDPWIVLADWNAPPQSGLEWDMIDALVQFTHSEFAPTRPVGDLHSTLRAATSAPEWLLQNSLSSGYNDEAVRREWNQVFPERMSQWLAYQSIP